MPAFPIPIDVIPDIQGYPCLRTEVGVDSATIQLGSPENVGLIAGTDTISQPMCEISQLPASVDAIPDKQVAHVC